MTDEKNDGVRKSMEEFYEDGKAPKKQKRLDAFMDKMAAPGPNEEAFFEERRREGLGVGLDEQGNLVKERERSDIKPVAHDDE